ncbi:DUF4262 domain-containing protein [Micromonospora chersina]|uniref:DUF4262 domain-containing protein n=1 Tax=Micromonospora chersina TaxID=47854 RepID=UPI003684C10D
MTDQPCHCLLCQHPSDEATWDQRDRRIADHIRQYGWSVTGLAEDERSPGWAYSTGLWHTLRSPEVCIFGLPTNTAMTIVNVVADQVREGELLKPDERRADVLTNHDVAIRPVHPAWYRHFFGAAVDFYQAPPLPIVQVFWPDKQGRFAWEQDAEANSRASQPLLWLSPTEHPQGVWTEFDPYEGWPFGTTLPYFSVRTTSAVVEGKAEVAAVVRGHDGSWRFLDGTGDGNATAVTNLRHIANAYPEVAAVADLAHGQRADRAPDGGWVRSALPS